MLDFEGLTTCPFCGESDSIEAYIESDPHTYNYNKTFSHTCTHCDKKYKVDFTAEVTFESYEE